MKKSSIK